MSDKQLGRLEKIELRNIWTSEASEFTPWLARPENLEVLSDTLGITLELEAQERFVGPFRADLLCKDIDKDQWVLIENQLERTDHTHLGQLLTYASGLQAVTIIWIAARFTEEHRATLDWLNKVTDEGIRFFGLEVELWRIGSSPAAPRFNIVSKPNNWAQSVKQAARAIDEGELSETRIRQREYWTGLSEVLRTKQGPVTGNRKPQAQSWMSYPTGKTRVHVNACMFANKDRIRAELYLGGVDAKRNFAQLRKKQPEIERALGYPLEWEELPEGQDSRIAVYLENASFKNADDWKRQHEWLADRLNEFHKVFAPAARELTLDNGRSETE